MSSVQHLGDIITISIPDCSLKENVTPVHIQRIRLGHYTCLHTELLASQCRLSVRLSVFHKECHPSSRSVNTPWPLYMPVRRTYRAIGITLSSVCPSVRHKECHLSSHAHADLLPTCYMDLSFMLRTCYGETGVMDFGL